MDDLPEGLLHLSRAGNAPMTGQLAGQLRALISGGRLKAGRRLPSSRALAAQLGVSRNTVTHAIEQLAAEGYLDVLRSRDGAPVRRSGHDPTSAFGMGAAARRLRLAAALSRPAAPVPARAGG